MTSNKSEGNWYVLLHGLSIESPSLLLVPGLSLRALETSLSVFDLAAAGAVGFREWALLEPLVGGCHCEILSAKDAATTPGYDTLNRAWLVSNMLNLLGHSSHLPIACSAYSWNIIAGHQQRTKAQFQKQMVEEGMEAAVYSPKHGLPPFNGLVLDYHVKILVPKSRRRDSVTEKDAEWISGHFDAFNMLASECEHFRIALEASVDWRYARDPRAAIACLWSGIEAIFRITGELVYRLSSLAASLLTPRGDSRIKKFKSIKRLYSKRSKAVHGETLSETDLYEAMDESFRLLQELILYIVEQGRPLTKADLDRALFC